MQNFAQKNMADVNICPIYMWFLYIAIGLCSRGFGVPHELLCFINESNVALGVFCFLVINALSVVLKP